MPAIIFYEKPGCAGNARQKARLRDAGVLLDVRNLLTIAWTPETLRPFFGDLPVADWFNRSAPAVKLGEVIPESLDEQTALTLMLATPLLIRRPLITGPDFRTAGFDWPGLCRRLGLPETGKESGDSLDGCAHARADHPPCGSAGE